jgi:polar amino acid transport system substrate-binding protein
MLTKTLRCAYIILPPEFTKDANTGKLMGFSYDAAEELGKRMHWKIDWVEEVNFGTMSEGFKTDRYDAICFSLYRYSPFAAIFEYSVPMFYSGTGVYVRADDHRFDNNLAAINDENVKVATMDAEMSQFVARDDFPKAKTVSLPQNSEMTQMMLMVETNKADVTFINNTNAGLYLQANPGKLRDIAADQPVRLFSHGFAFKKGELELLTTVNYVFEEMLNDGTMNKIVMAHEKIPGNFLFVAKPYQHLQ